MDSVAASSDIVVEYALGFLLIATIFFLPSIIAFGRRHPNRWVILILNFVFGGTGVGWLGTLIWAFNAVHRPAELGRSPGGESGLNVFINDPVRLAPVADAIAGPISRQGPRISASDAIAELDRLSRLHSAGHLSDGEFATLKHEVLNRMRTG